MTTNSTPDLPTRRDAFYRELEPHAMAALWTRLRKLIPSEPTPAGVAHRWPYAAARPYLMESATLISAEEAERRVLLMENPGLPGTSCITSTMYAGLQLILPGEVAPAHRHSQSALRFIVEGSGAYTAVDGEKTYMEAGDFVITPAWTWHHHGHEGSAPMVWVDGLDIPIVSFFNGGFREEFDSDEAPVTRPAGDALARYGTGLMPVGYQPSTLNSPVFNYPYARTREALFALPHAGAPDPHAGYLMRYTNPVDGGWAMPTIATMIRLLPSGFATLPYRSTDSAVFICVEGRGHVMIGDRRLELAPHDLVVVPGWSQYTLHASEDLVLFSYSDRVAQEKLGLFREQRF
ncbi:MULTISPECIES: gentisate 1,2-dioxygenase [unclassified Cupriavidus]|uniref:gentisate 1,2-dioxygenase n=1 Tax=unclassified Cupriavidus TaxID=2640874 RepID=UPI0004233A2F|nr:MULTISPECIES: gentisate 1,2-dioxygenase [unclassified Cupriavidus]MBP0630271.1 gentisate 1,2-dioxygenase [Cupriavidus sp. AcVe19-1a]MBP0634084.1 gentisate 1,2-dioxygenase [Cupriavidus sp. AcVe19-6a]